jgi:HEAT repeat protein
VGAIQGAWAAPQFGAVHAARQAPDYPGLDDPDPVVRAETVLAIREVKAVDAVPALIAHLEDPDQRVGLYIAQALVELVPADTVNLLQLPLLIGNTDVRWRAAFVLGERKESRAVSMLARALKDEDVLVSSTAAAALAKIGTRAAINALIASMMSRRPSEVHVAMNGLLVLSDVAVPALAQALESADGHAEFHAATVLEAIGTPAAQAALHNDSLQ